MNPLASFFMYPYAKPDFDCICNGSPRPTHVRSLYSKMNGRKNWAETERKISLGRS